MPDREYRDERVVREDPPREVVHEEREVRERPVYEERADRPVESETGTSWMSFALFKYGFILILVIVVLYFIAQFVLPLLP
jgi:hypothetical protein